jgi:hypothetical protein
MLNQITDEDDSLLLPHLPRLVSWVLDNVHKSQVWILDNVHKSQVGFDQKLCQN